MAVFHTFILRGGRFNECRLTCPESQTPHTVVFFSHPSNDSGELYELKHGEYVLEDDEDDGECG